MARAWLLVPFVLGAVGAVGALGHEPAAVFWLGGGAVGLGALVGGLSGRSAPAPMAAWFLGALLAAGRSTVPDSPRSCADAVFTAGGLAGVALGAAVAGLWRAPRPDPGSRLADALARGLGAMGVVHAGTWGVLAVAIAADARRSDLGKVLMVAGMVVGGVGSALVPAAVAPTRLGALASAVGALVGAVWAMPDRDRMLDAVVAMASGRRAWEAVVLVVASWPGVVFAASLGVAALADRARAARAAREGVAERSSV